MEEARRDGRREGNDTSKGTPFQRTKPYIFGIFSAFCFAGYVIISKVSLDQGMSPYVLLAYGHVFGTLSTAVLSLLFERNNDSKLSTSVCIRIFFMGALSSLGRILLYVGLKYTSPTIAAAMGNLLPSMTFILAFLCRTSNEGFVVSRMEKVDITKFSSQAKIGGTLAAFGGAALMTLYKGILVLSVTDRWHSHQITSLMSPSKSTSDKNLTIGSVVIIVQVFIVALFFILQTTTIRKYPAPLTLTTLTCLSGSTISLVIAAIFDHKSSSWRLSWDITVAAALYNGIILHGVYNYVNTLIVRRKGPVFVTAFRPLSTVIAAIMALIFLKDALYLGEILGSTVIIFGLYGTLWGKKVERDTKLFETTMSHPQTIENR